MTQILLKLYTQPKEFYWYYPNQDRPNMEKAVKSEFALILTLHDQHVPTFISLDMLGLTQNLIY